MGQDEKAALLARITTNPEIFGGKPIIRGQRIAVEHVLDMLGVGDTVAEILDGYPFLELNDIRACLLFGAERAREMPATKAATSESQTFEACP